MYMLSPDARNVIVDTAFMVQKVCMVLLESNAQHSYVMNNVTFANPAEQSQYFNRRISNLTTALNNALARLDSQFPEYDIRFSPSDVGYTLYANGPHKAYAHVSISNEAVVQYFNVYQDSSRSARHTLWSAPTAVSPFDIPYLMRNAGN